MYKSFSKYNLFFAVILVFALLATAAGCGGEDNRAENGDDAGITVRVGSQGYAEVEILGEMAKAIIEEHTPHTVEHVTNLGSAFAAYTATTQGDLQIQVNFTGSLFLGNLEMTLTDEWRDPEKVYQFVKEGIRELDNLHVFAPLGYNNTYAIAVPREWAEENNVTRISDLEPFAADMILAVDSYWRSAPGQGYPEFVELYGFEFKQVPEMDFGLMYRSIAQGDVQAICCYSTDGQLLAHDLLVLEDDLGYNPPYNGVYVARLDTLEQYPEIKEALEMLEGMIDTEQMQALNNRVAVDEVEPRVVARDFLREIGLIE